MWERYVGGGLGHEREGRGNEDGCRELAGDVFESISLKAVRQQLQLLAKGFSRSEKIELHTSINDTHPPIKRHNHPHSTETPI